MKYLLMSLLLSFSAYASDFDGCGEYEFKGVLKIDKDLKNQMAYVVHEGTKSQMIFEFENEEDIIRMSPFLNIQSAFTATVSKEMNGTKGAVKNVTGISKVFPDPLKNTDTGLKKIKPIKCL